MESVFSGQPFNTFKWLDLKQVSPERIIDMYLMVTWCDANRLRLKLTGPIKKEGDEDMEDLIRWKWSCVIAIKHLTWHGMVWVGNQLMLRILKLHWVDCFISQLCVSHPLVGEFMSGPAAAAAAIQLREKLTSLPVCIKPEEKQINAAQAAFEFTVWLSTVES